MAKAIRKVSRSPRKKTLLTKVSVTPVQSWWPRFWAWVIDTIVLGVVLFALFPRANLGIIDADVVQSLTSAAVVFIYWTLTDSDGRQSIGKKALGLKLVKINGRDADLANAAVSAFGKAFLLPLDFLIGVLARPGKKQRLFNIISDTVVVKTA